jgi:predicted transposase YbfD/YdcC
VCEVWKIRVLISREVRYFVSSLDASSVSAERFIELVAGHWQVENCLHLVKDRWRGEDKHVFHRSGLGEIWSALTSCVVSLLHSWKDVKEKITKAALNVAHKPLKLLGV